MTEIPQLAGTDFLLSKRFRRPFLPVKPICLQQ